MKKFIMALTVLLALTLASGSTFAGDPSSKVTGAYSGLALLNTQEGVWTPILTSQIKTAEWADLNVDVSLECGLYTRTKVKSKGGVEGVSAAEASVRVRVLLDGDVSNPAIPGDVVFCRRSQELTAKFGGIFESCYDMDGDGTVTIPDECEITDEELQLVLKTVNANAFNFVIPDMSSGMHTIQVQAIVDTCTGTLDVSGDCIDGTADATARGTIGKGSVAIDEVRYIKDAGL
jgi:hypothetical protein